jgi:hypothetical protein
VLSFLCRTDVFYDVFEFLINSSSQSVCNAASCQCDRAWLPECFMHLGGSNIKRDVFDFERAPKECAFASFVREWFLVLEEFDDIFFHADD